MVALRELEGGRAGGEHEVRRALAVLAAQERQELDVQRLRRVSQRVEVLREDLELRRAGGGKGLAKGCVRLDARGQLGVGASQQDDPPGRRAEIAGNGRLRAGKGQREAGREEA